MMNQTAVVPVLFIHFGNIPKYLINAISKANSFGNKVYLLTDNISIKVDAEIVDVKSINFDEDIFKSFYKHMSSNSYQFEYMCIYRWFILKNFMNKHQIKIVLYLDSDVYLYSSTSDIISNYPGFEFAYSIPEIQKDFYWAGSACCSLWSDNSINAFCEKIKTYYITDSIQILDEKWKYHTDNNILGGICDMTFLYFFSKENGFLNLGKVYNNCCFDFNNAISANYYQNEYAFNQSKLFQIPTKDINFINGIPYCQNIHTGNNIRFFALTEYAKLLVYSKKQNLFKKIINKMYALKNRILN